MLHTNAGADARVAVLVDCDNIKPEALDFALRMVAQFGRVVLRRGHGNHATLANKWQEALVRLAFKPCLQYQYAAGKNTSDIALELDAIEAVFDQRADTFCLVTSASDFAYRPLTTNPFRGPGAHHQELHQPEVLGRQGGLLPRPARRHRGTLTSSPFNLQFSSHPTR